MGRKNKKLIILVAILLLAGSISFAYFVGTAYLKGDGASASGTTATINGVKVTTTGNLEFNDLSIYPGHQNVSSIKVTATGDNQLVPYNLIWNGINSLNTTLNYTVYKTSSDIDIEVSCEKKTVVVDGAQHLSEECTINNLESLGSAVASGNIAPTTNETTITLVEDEFITATSDGMSVYYYIVLEYPNLESNQNSDLNGSINGKVNVTASNTEPDINILAAYIKNEDTGEYEQTEDIPQSGYTLNTSKSTCSNGATPNWDIDNSRLYIDNLTKGGTSCYLYFDEYDPTGSELILANKTLSVRNDFSVALTADTTGTMYYAEDDYGTSYYYSGAPTDNWLKFAGYYWRIIRINGDGTIRLIYNGTTLNLNGTDTQIGTSSFNPSNKNNMYLGYMYTSGSVHGLGTSSTIKGTIDSWYTSNLASYASYIDPNAGFCGDRVPYTSSIGTAVGGGTGTTNTYYASTVRLNYNKNPNFKCTEKSDLYTITSATAGNKSLTYPIGLITADEAAYAGGVISGYNESFYLNTGQNYWTISPNRFENNYAYMLTITKEGIISAIFSDTSNLGVRPVINLRSDIKLTGSGTNTNPYIVVGAE